jgi:hypothetical protein
MAELKDWLNRLEEARERAFDRVETRLGQILDCLERRARKRIVSGTRD